MVSKMAKKAASLLELKIKELEYAERSISRLMPQYRLITLIQEKILSALLSGGVVGMRSAALNIIEVVGEWANTTDERSKHSASLEAAYRRREAMKGGKK